MKKEMVYGIHAVHSALQHFPEDALELWLQQGKLRSAALEKVLYRAKQAGVSIQSVSRAALNKHAGETNHQGVILKRKPNKKIKTVNLDNLLANELDANLLLLVLDGLHDPHNLGACLRTADAAGVNAVIIPKDRSVTVNATVSKVASGGAEHIPVLTETNIARALRTLQKAGVWVLGMDDQSGQSLYDLDLKIPLAIVMGNEGQGLRHNTHKQCDYLVNLPMHGVVESLNVSVATGICLYEILRQRKTA